MTQELSHLTIEAAGLEQAKRPESSGETVAGFPNIDPAIMGDLAPGVDCRYLNCATCPDCGGGMVRLGNCFSCPECGFESCGLA